MMTKYAIEYSEPDDSRFTEVYGEYTSRHDALEASIEIEEIIPRLRDMRRKIVKADQA